MKTVFDKEFAPYGKVIEGYDFTELLKVLNETTEKPDKGTIYEPGYDKLEALPVCSEIRDHIYGGMPIQIGYCNGFNTMLNCLEYHRDSEFNIPADDIVLMLVTMTDIVDGKIDTSKVKAFKVPAGTGVLTYETSLHYAPANAAEPFRVAVVLPKNTNTDMPDIKVKTEEDKLLRARNKWLFAHPDSSEAKEGAYVGLTGKNIDVRDFD